MDELPELLRDPRPTQPDSMRWRCLFIQIHKIGMPHSRALDLASRMQTIREMGTVLRADLTGLKFRCLLHTDGGHWESEDFFREIVTPTLAMDFKNEIIVLLRRVEEIVDRREVQSDGGRSQRALPSGKTA